MAYVVYVLSCNDGTFYTGITTDIARRVREHNTSSLGAKYTKARRPVTVVYTETCANRSEAQKREYQIRHLTHAQKLGLMQK